MTHTQHETLLDAARHRLHDALEAHEDDRADNAYDDIDWLMHIPCIPEQRQPT